MQHGGSDLEHIADQSGRFVDSRDRQILAKLPIGQTAAGEFRLPIPVVLDRISVDRLIRPAMCGQVGLSVALDTECADPTPPPNRFLEDARGHDGAFMDHFFRL